MPLTATAEACLITTEPLTTELEFDEKAVGYGRQHGLPMTAGSDIHRTDLLGGGMAFRRKLESIQDFMEAVRNGEDYLLTNGDDWFAKDGSRITL